MKKIIIALDYDPTAEKVAETGYQLAKSMQAETILLHVLSDSSFYMPLEYSPIMGFPGMPALDIIEPLNSEELQKAALAFLESSRNHLGDTNIRIMTAEGEFAESILQIASDNEADIIVIGSHSRSAFEKILMGSVTEKLLHHSKIPLFIVPTGKKEK